MHKLWRAYYELAFYIFSFWNFDGCFMETTVDFWIFFTYNYYIKLRKR